MPVVTRRTLAAWTVFPGYRVPTVLPVISTSTSPLQMGHENAIHVEMPNRSFMQHRSFISGIGTDGRFRGRFTGPFHRSDMKAAIADMFATTASDTPITVGKVIIAAMVSLWLSIPAAIQILFCLGLVDVVTSFLTQRRTMMAVVKKLTLILILCGTVCVIYDMAKNNTGLNIGFDVCTGVAAFYCLGEIIAILQNLSWGGVDFPPFLLTALSKAGGLTGRQQGEIDALFLKQKMEKEIMDTHATQYSPKVTDNMPASLPVKTSDQGRP